MTAQIVIFYRFQFYLFRGSSTLATKPGRFYAIAKEKRVSYFILKCSPSFSLFFPSKANCRLATLTPSLEYTLLCGEY